MNDEAMEVLVAAILAYFVGIPVVGGYILAATGYSLDYAWAVFCGAVFWPVTLLGYLGTLIAA